LQLNGVAGYSAIRWAVRRRRPSGSAFVAGLPPGTSPSAAPAMAAGAVAVLGGLGVLLVGGRTWARIMARWR
jgi:hypothetical protein